MTSQPPENSAAQPQTRRKSGGTFVLVIVLLLVALGLAFTGLALWPDVPPPQDEAYLPKWREELSKNPLSHFESVIALQKPTKPDHRVWEQLSSGQWDTKTGEDIVSNHSELLASFDALAQATEESWQWRNPEELANFVHFATNSRSLEIYIQNLAIVRGRNQLAQKKSSELEWSIEAALRVGAAMNRAEGGFQEREVARGFILQGLMMLYSARDSKVLGSSESDLRYLMTLLREIEPAPTHLGFSLQVDYRTHGNFLNEFKAGELADFDDRFARLQWLKPFVKTNRSTRTYLEITKPLFLACREDWEAISIALVDVNKEIDLLYSGKVTEFVSTNALGRFLSNVFLRVEAMAVLKELETVATIRAWQVVLALDLYTQRHGVLPKDLKQLVPEFLPVIPIDPFSGEPLLWDPEKKVVYSIGSNGIDEGGLIIPTELGETRDVGIPW